MKQTHYYIDTSSILDLEAYGLIKRLRKVKIVVVPEVLREIKDRGLEHRLKRIVTDLGPQQRAAFVPGLDSMDYGERAIIKAMLCDRGRRQRHRVYVSNDESSRTFVSAGSDDICEDVMDTSEFLSRLYREGIVKMEDIRNALSCGRRPPNRKCRERFERIIAEYDMHPIS